MITKTQSGKENPNVLRAWVVEKLESMGEFQRKAFEYPALFLALSIVYSCYLKVSLDHAACPARPEITTIDFALLLTAIKFFLITGWPCAVLASLDPAWRGKDSAHVSLFAYAATNVFWIHKYGGGFCIYCVIFGLVAYTFSAGIGHGVGLAFRSMRLPGKNILLAGGLLAFITVLRFDHHWGDKSQTPEIVTVSVRPAPPLITVPAKISAAHAQPNPDYSATAQKAAETPHFWQLDPRGGFLNGGRDYCGPVAISDSLVYLGRHGFPDLMPDSQGDQAQIDMINLLASPHYLGTNPDKGTGAGAILRGIEKYVVGHGYQCTTMEYKGWSKVGKRQQEFVLGDRPDLDWLKKGVLDPHGAAWLAVGWYARTGDGQWKRSGGHWVAMVGFDARDPRALLIDNPGTRGQANQPDDPAQDVVHLQPVDAGTLDTGDGPPQDASGRYQVSGPGLPMGRNQVAFLDAAIVIVVSKL